MSRPRLLGLAAALTLVGSAGATAARVYRVQAGDTLYSLAKSSGTTVLALQKLNHLTATTLRVGQAMQLPVQATAGGHTPPPGPAAPVSVATLPAEPAAAPAPVYQSGLAVYYGGRADARTVLTAAHLTLPFGTWVEVKHQRTGRTVLVLINDRGPFGRPERVIDLSAAAARVLGITGEGVAPVTLRIARTP